MNIIETVNYVGTEEGAQRFIDKVFEQNVRIETINVIAATDKAIDAALRRVLGIPARAGGSGRRQV